MTTESKVAADRGKIYDRNGNVLATNVTTYRVFISPSSIKLAQDDLDEGSGKNYYKIKNHIVTEVDLNDSSSHITYYVEITNYGSTDVGIYNITGLPENLNYQIKDY